MAAPKRFSVTEDISDNLLKAYLAQKVVAVDTELDGLRLGRDQVRLVQVSDEKQNVALVVTAPPKAPPNLKKLLTAKNTCKIFHFAITDVAFLRTSLNVDVNPFVCTKVMSKVVRTYTEGHSLRHLAEELLGVKLEKQFQNTNWADPTLSASQLKYAANDVLHLVEIYRRLQKMLSTRGELPSGLTAMQLNERAQACLPTIVDLLINGYGDRDNGWESTIFTH
ncbi:MAG: 3'-5' exonuclease [Candidatus Lambdaproteobacteria bacterium]|nr:3'-5' exonuclease [Candidatus Lambdaproteobacteria bacterium]